MKRSILMVILIMFAGKSSAEILVYEGYNYGDSVISNIETIVVNATGLDSSYDDISNDQGAGGYLHYSPVGLNFGTNFFADIGGAFVFNAYHLSNDARSFAIGLTADEARGKIYNSFLVEFVSINSKGIGTLRIKDSTSTYGLQVRCQMQDEEKPGVDYSGNTAVSATEAGTIQENTTYLLVSYFTNVGESSGGTANMFMFTESAYNDWCDDGYDESKLGDYAVWQASDSGAEIHFNNWLAFTNYQPNNGGKDNTLILDEIRWGTKFSDVVCIPARGTIVVVK